MLTSPVLCVILTWQGAADEARVLREDAAEANEELARVRRQAADTERELDRLRRSLSEGQRRQEAEALRQIEGTSRELERVRAEASKQRREYQLSLQAANEKISGLEEGGAKRGSDHARLGWDPPALYPMWPSCSPDRGCV